MAYGAHESAVDYVLACFADHILEATTEADEATKRAISQQSSFDYFNELYGPDHKDTKNAQGFLTQNNTMAVNERTIAEAYTIATQAVAQYFGK
jgi:hypothetical protein